MNTHFIEGHIVKSQTGIWKVGQCEITDCHFLEVQIGEDWMPAKIDYSGSQQLLMAVAETHTWQLRPGVYGRISQIH